MGLVADDQVYAHLFQETRSGRYHTMLASWNGQAIDDRSHREIAEVTMIAHGRGEHYDPTANLQIRTHDQSLEAGVVLWVTNAENAAASIREQGVRVGRAIPYLVGPLIEVAVADANLRVRVSA